VAQSRCSPPSSLSSKSGDSSLVGSSAKSASSAEQDQAAPHLMNVEAGPGQKSKRVGLGLGLGLGHNPSTDRGVKGDQNSTQDEGAGPLVVCPARERAIALQLSFDKISEIEDETEDGEAGNTGGGSAWGRRGCGGTLLLGALWKAAQGRAGALVT